MKFLEQLALECAPSRPRLWKRYVDDTCCIVRSREVEEFHKPINSIGPSIQFIVELEKEGTLPFLDTLLQRRKEGSLDVRVYRKPTHTKRYLNFGSNHPGHLKRGLVRCLFVRAQEVTLDNKNLSKARKHLHEVLNANGYPKRFISSATAPARNSSQREQDWEPKVTITIPYVAVVSEEIRRICNDFDIRVALRTAKTIRSELTRLKDPLPLEKQSTVEYWVHCSSGQAYIGKTVR